MPNFFKPWAKNSLRGGFFSVELLVVLFIAASFIIGGYQIYSAVIDSTAHGASDIAASNIASDFVELNRYQASTPCNEKTVLQDYRVETELLPGAVVDVKITCPIQGVSTFIKNGVSSKIEATVTYDNGRKTSANKIVNNKVNIKQVATHDSFTAVLGDDGHVYTWGSNEGGQLGNRTLGNANLSPVPVRVKTFGTPMATKKIIKIAVGHYHVLALDSEGELYAWGANKQTQLGAGQVYRALTPIKVLATGNSSLTGKKIKDIAATLYSNVAVDTAGNVHTWGYNAQGQLGDGSTQNDPLPKQIAPSVLKNIKKVAAGRYSVLALNENGKLYGWGWNGYGQLGNGTTNSPVTNPIAITGGGLSSVVLKDMTTGGYHSMALANNGDLYTWGANNYGQLGNGTLNNSYTPQKLTTTSQLTGKDINTLAAGEWTSYATDVDGALYSWGNSALGQLGIEPLGAPEDSRKARRVTTANTPIRGVRISQVAAGRNHVVVLGENGQVYSFGDNQLGQLGSGDKIEQPTAVAVENGTTVVKLASGAQHTIALLSNGLMYAWGQGTGGALGDQTATTKNFPVRVVDTGVLKDKKIIDVVAGNSHNLALDKDNNLYAWGLNSNGQVGDGSTTSRNTAVLINSSDSPLNNKIITKIAAAGNNSMVLTSDGEIYVWGNNTYGQVGNNSTASTVNVPTRVNADSGSAIQGKTITNVSLGNFSGYAVDDTGKAYAWGRGASYALGNGLTANQTRPIQVATDSGLLGKKVVFVEAGSQYAIAQTEEGQAYGWGLGTSGQLGVGDAATKSKPTLQPADVTYTQIAPGESFVVAQGEDGYVYTWGNNTQYQQANGGTANVTTPLKHDPFTSNALRQVSANNSSAFVLDWGNHLYGWGLNSTGNMGIGDVVTPQQSPRPITRIQYDNVW